MDPTNRQQLATTAASVLVSAPATAVWPDARGGFVRLLGTGDRDREMVAGRLDRLAAEIEQAPPAERETVRWRSLPGWQARLLDFLEANEAAASPLGKLRDEIRSRLPTPQQQWVQNITASASGATAQGAMFGNVINHYGPPTAGPPVRSGSDD
ncbi:hypothetical protein [Micromonospora sp. NPDC048830]|uniref:hypothetical protein n=1 Tax=Micromonospora sp. NPDC048830 TaxID=3364257 RepID=UPI0037164577